jgi:hypothetical protein
MATNLPSASQWTALCRDFGLKDNGVQKKLADYERLGDDKPAERADALAQVVKLAGVLKQSKEAKANADAGKAIDGVVASAQAASKADVAAAAKATAAEKQKPDFAKIKALLTEVRKIGKLPPASGAGPAGAKGGRDLPCYDLKEEADRQFLILDLATVAAIGALVELAAAFPAAALGAATSDAARRGLTLALMAAIATFLSQYHDFIEAENAWEACLRANKLDLATFVGTQLKRARELRDRVLRARDEIQRWVQMFPSL